MSRFPVRKFAVALCVSVVFVAAATKPSDAQLGALHAPSLQALAAVQAVDGVHEPPVDAPIIDPYRAPEHAFGPGNRGIEYAPTVGQIVTASAAGTVSFAGQVGGSLFVTVDHGGGLRTTVGQLSAISVSAGESVDLGSPLALAGVATHFSARQDGQYFDPELLFGSVRIEVRLVPRSS